MLAVRQRPVPHLAAALGARADEQQRVAADRADRAGPRRLRSRRWSAGVSSGSDWWPLPPNRQAAITSAVTTAMPMSVSQTSFDSSRRLRPCVLRAVEAAPHPALEHLVARAVADVVLVHVQLSVEPEVVGVRAQEALDVGRRGQRLERSRPRARAGTSRGSSSPARARGSRAPCACAPRGGCSRSRTCADRIVGGRRRRVAGAPGYCSANRTASPRTRGRARRSRRPAVRGSRGAGRPRPRRRRPRARA